MSSRLPPVPDENRSPQGSSSPDQHPKVKSTKGSAENPDKIGQQGNTKVNTIHQGYQQDR